MNKINISSIYTRSFVSAVTVLAIMACGQQKNNNTPAKPAPPAAPTPTQQQDQSKNGQNGQQPPPPPANQNAQNGGQSNNNSALIPTTNSTPNLGISSADAPVAVDGSTTSPDATLIATQAAQMKNPGTNYARVAPDTTVASLTQKMDSESKSDAAKKLDLNLAASITSIEAKIDSCVKTGTNLVVAVDRQIKVKNKKTGKLENATQQQLLDGFVPLSLPQDAPVQLTNRDKTATLNGQFRCLDKDPKNCLTSVITLVDSKSKAEAVAVWRKTPAEPSVPDYQEAAPTAPNPQYTAMASVIQATAAGAKSGNAIKDAWIDTAEVIHGVTNVRVTLQGYDYEVIGLVGTLKVTNNAFVEDSLTKNIADDTLIDDMGTAVCKPDTSLKKVDLQDSIQAAQILEVQNGQIFTLILDMSMDPPRQSLRLQLKRVFPEIGTIQ